MTKERLETKLLSIGAVAQMAGVTVETVRAWHRDGKLSARRTPGRQRRFLEFDVVRFLRRRGTDSQDKVMAHHRRIRTLQAVELDPITDDVPPEVLFQDPIPRVSSKDAEVRDARAHLELLRTRKESEAVARASRAQAEEAAREKEKQRSRRETERRLADLKAHGRGLALDLPAEYRAGVTADLETYVTPRQFPSTIPQWEAWAFVQARVEQHRTRFREARDAKLKEAERQRELEQQQLQAANRKRDRERESVKRQAEVRRLVDFGKNDAFFKTIRWPAEERGEACLEVEQALEEEVESDWTQADVLELVREVLDEWEDDESE